MQGIVREYLRTCAKLNIMTVLRGAPLSTIASAKQNLPCRAQGTVLGRVTELLGWDKEKKERKKEEEEVKGTNLLSQDEKDGADISDIAEPIKMDDQAVPLPSAVRERIRSLVFKELPDAITIDDWRDYPFKNHFLKYRILLSIESEFQVNVANYRLHKMKTLGDIEDHILEILIDQPGPRFPSINRKTLPANLNIEF